MKKLVMILAIAAFGISSYALDLFFSAPNYNEIEKNIKNENSSYFYPQLMARYMKGDPTLTAEEGRHLYFGYVYQPNYVPTDTSSYNNHLAQVLTKTSFSTTDYNNILQYADALLAEDPFNLRALNAKLLVYAQQNNVEEYKIVAQKRKVVQDAIVSTGDGMSDKTPFYVIKVAHEYDLLPFLGYKFGGVDKIVKNKKVNYLSLGKNRFEVERVYFDITPIMNYVTTQGGGKM